MNAERYEEHDAEKTLLLVEDEAIIAMVEAQMLESFGYRVVTALSGEEAVEQVMENGAISLVLMDIDLGSGMDGAEAAQRILDVRNLPIIFLTSHSERAMVEKVQGITRFGYVIKSTGDFVLRSTIEMAYELFEKQREKS
jgi:CheY-like chemotaxis protein